MRGNRERLRTGEAYDVEGKSGAGHLREWEFTFRADTGGLLEREAACVWGRHVHSKTNEQHTHRDSRVVNHSIKAAGNKEATVGCE